MLQADGADAGGTSRGPRGSSRTSGRCRGSWRSCAATVAQPAGSVATTGAGSQVGRGRRPTCRGLLMFMLSKVSRRGVSLGRVVRRASAMLNTSDPWARVCPGRRRWSRRRDLNPWPAHYEHSGSQLCATSSMTCTDADGAQPRCEALSGQQGGPRRSGCSGRSARPGDRCLDCVLRGVFTNSNNRIFWRIFSTCFTTASIPNSVTSRCNRSTTAAADRRRDGGPQAPAEALKVP